MKNTASFQKFEDDWKKIQEQKHKESKIKMVELDEEFPLKDRIMRLEQLNAEKQAAKKLSELEEGAEDDIPIDTSILPELSGEDIIDVLGLTIKRDSTNKLVTFLALLTAYTEDSQLNISFNAPSSSGKSFIPTEIAKLFPQKDVIEVAYCSPTAFFHDVGKFDQEKQGYIVDLSRKILIFLDQPHTQLLQHLRPMLSHDKKVIQLKITDKSQKAGLKTKNIFLIGYPTVIFCTAGLNLDEQETTRFLLLSPEIDQEKIREAIFEKILKESDSVQYNHKLNLDPKRDLLKKRIIAIKQEKIKAIRIDSSDLVKNRFLEKIKKFKPRHQRDIGRIISLIKVNALLNLWFRKRIGSTIIANEKDINEAYKLWNTISESQELNLPPFVYNLYKDIILKAYLDKNGILLSNVVKLGLTRSEILQKHSEVYGRYLPDWQLRQQIIPMLETSGLITQENDSNDKRKVLIHPTTPLTLGKNNSESDGGVKSKAEDELTYVEQIALAKEVFAAEDQLEGGISAKTI